MRNPFTRNEKGNYTAHLNGPRGGFCTVFKQRRGWKFVVEGTFGKTWYATPLQAMNAARIYTGHTEQRTYDDYDEDDYKPSPKVPACLAFFGLTPPISKEALMRAYRQKAKTTHPDCGGTHRAFLEVSMNFKAAMQLVQA